MHADRLRALFLAEGRECLASLDGALLALERAPADADARERAFRALHTLKGMSATLALAPLVALAHAGEEGLVQARATGRVEPALREPHARLLREVQRAIDAFEAGAPLDDAALDAATVALRAALVASAHDVAASEHAAAPLAQLDAPASAAAPATGTATRTARIPVERLDALLDLAGELLIARDRLVGLLPDDAPGGTTAGAQRASLARRDAVAALERTVDRMRDAVVTARLVPVAQVLDRFPRVVRDTAQALGKDVELVVEGRELEVDRSLLEELGEPLLHLVRNALDHGVESPDARVAAHKPRAGRLVLRVRREGDLLAVTVADDGAGVDRAAVVARAQALGVAHAASRATDDEGLLALLAHPGLSTAAVVTPLSGRGTGMDAVLARVRAAGGRAALATATGRGTAVTLHLPVSVAIVRALLVRAGDETCAIPVRACLGTRRMEPALRIDGARPRYRLDDAVIPLVSLHAQLGLAGVGDAGQVVVVRGAAGRTALHVDACLAQRDVVVKPLPRVRGAGAIANGATLLGDGTPALVLDPTAL
jgi:two-component system chemotaxis sensor kinase CheA